MKKSDVKLSYHQGYSGKPMVNVKVHADTGWDALAAIAERHAGEFNDTLFVPWLRERAAGPEAESLWDSAWGTALEDGWQHLEDDLGNVWEGRSDLKVYSAGRSGGWAVVDGLPDVESWDAVALARWAKYARYARAQVDDIPYLMVWDLFHNGPFVAYREQVDACMAQAARDAGVIT